MRHSITVEHYSQILTVLLLLLLGIVIVAAVLVVIMAVLPLFVALIVLMEQPRLTAGDFTCKDRQSCPWTTSNSLQTPLQMVATCTSSRAWFTPALLAAPVPPALRLQ